MNDEDDELEDEDEDELEDDDADDDDDAAAPWASDSDGDGDGDGDGSSAAAPGQRRQPVAAPAPVQTRRSPNRAGPTAQRTASGGTDVENVTRRVMDRFGCEGFLFTALDVSNQVKLSLPGVRHREVAPIVRDLFDDGVMGATYLQTLIDVQLPNGQATQAFLYHLDSDDPDDYAGTQRQQAAIPPVPVHQLVQGGVLPAELTIEIGKDGRARIPRDFLERNGLTSGTVHVEQAPTPKTLVLCEPRSATGPALASLAYVHPTLLYMPVTLLQAFDLTKSVVAKPHARGVMLIEV
jgi:hypothetical protein